MLLRATALFALAAGVALLALPAAAAPVSTLERVAAIEDIKNLKARYLIAVDNRDAATLKRVFAKDVVADYTAVFPVDGSGKKVLPTPFRGADEASQAVAGSVKSGPFTTFHNGGLPIIEVTSPTTAWAIWPLMGFGRPDAATGATPTRVGTWYYYYDTYERIGGEWKIKTLRLAYTPPAEQIAAANQAHGE